jgi:hypothetical protein
MYVYYVVTMEISGAFAFAYDFQFFLAIAIGVIALKRKEIAGPSEHLDSETVVWPRVASSGRITSASA